MFIVTETEITKQDDKIQLKRELGLFSAINFILSIMIGSGIFVSSGSALKYSGSVGMCIIVWAFSGIISLLGKMLLNVQYACAKRNLPTSSYLHFSSL